MVPRQQVSDLGQRDRRQRYPLPGETSSDTLLNRGRRRNSEPQSTTLGVSGRTPPQSGTARAPTQDWNAETHNDNTSNEEAPRRRTFPDFSYEEQEHAEHSPLGCYDHPYPVAAAAHAVANRKVPVEGSAANVFRSTSPPQPAADGGGYRGEAKTDGPLRGSRAATGVEASVLDAAAAAPGGAKKNQLGNNNCALPAPGSGGGAGGGGRPRRRDSETVEYGDNLPPPTRGERHDRIQLPQGWGRQDEQTRREVEGRYNRHGLPREPEGRTQRRTMAPRETEERGHGLVVRTDCYQLDRSESVDVEDRRRHHHQRSKREQEYHNEEQEPVNLNFFLSNTEACDESLGRAKEGRQVERRSETGGGRGEAPLPTRPTRPQQPPGFVVHAEAVFRWMGVGGLTPEVLRRAKRGLREKQVVSERTRTVPTCVWYSSSFWSRLLR